MTVRDRVADALLRLQAMQPDSIAVLADQTAFERLVSDVSGRASYDWSSLSGSLFPSGSLQDFDISKADALAEWQQIRAGHRALVADALREYLDNDFRAKRNFSLAATGITLDVSWSEMKSYEPVRFDSQEVVDAFLHVGMIYTPAVFDPQIFDSVSPRPYKRKFQKNPTRLTARLLALAEVLNNSHTNWLTASQFVPTNLTDVSTYIALFQYMHENLDQDRVFALADAHLSQVAPAATMTPTPAIPSRSLADILSDRVREAQRKQDPSTALDAFKNFGILGRRAFNANASRTWGIELEVTDAGGVPTPAGWLKERDGSLRPMIGDGRLYDPWEFVSPILRKTYDPGLKELCSYIENSVQYVRAGVHVHVSATDVKGNRMTTYQVSRLIEIYATISRLLDPVIQRDERDFCVPTVMEDWAAGWFRREYPNKFRPGHPKRGRATGMHADAFENAKLNAQMTNSSDPNNEPTRWKRYQEVNLQSLNKHGTIEFRAMGPVYRFEYLSRWAWFLRELVNIAADESISTKPVYRFTTLDEVMSWVDSHAIEKLAAPKAKKATIKRRAPKALQTA